MSSTELLPGKLSLLAAIVLLATSLRAAEPTHPTEQDRQVLSAALACLLAEPDYNFARTREERPTVVFYDTTPEKTGMIQPGQMQANLRDGRSLPGEVQNSLLKRNQRGDTYDTLPVSFAGAKLGPQVVVASGVLDDYDLGEFARFKRPHPEARAWVKAWLPGYSANGKQAVVCAFVGPTAHGALVTVFLEQRNGQWTVRWHDLAVFA